MLNFKSWLLENDYVWNGKLETGTALLPNSIRITVLKGKKLVEIENSSYTNPKLKDALKSLLTKQPEVSDYHLYFDGHTLPETVQEFLKLDRDVLPDYVYTGTSTKRYEKIKVEGLKPRNLTGSEPVHGTSNPSQTDRVYFSVSPGNTTKFAARDAARDGSTPIILAVQTEYLDAGKLVSDEDSGCALWKDSICVSSNFAYRGTVKPLYIKPYMTLKDGKWTVL